MDGELPKSNDGDGGAEPASANPDGEDTKNYNEPEPDNELDREALRRRKKSRELINFFLVTGIKTCSCRKLVKRVKQRWRTERAYEDLKGELGLDHFEGRSYRGWHHHVTVALCCYAFVVAEQARHFPPSAGRPRPDGPNGCTA